MVSSSSSFRRTLLKRSAAVVLSVAAACSTAPPAQADPRVGGEIGYAYEYRYSDPCGFLGEPLTPEIRTPDDKGAYVAFQNDFI